MIEADRTVRLQVIHTKLRSRLTLLSGSEGGKAQYILRPDEELREAALKIIIGGNVVEDGVLGLKRRQIAASTETLGLRKPKVGLVELDGTTFKREFRDFSRYVLGNALLDLQPSKVRPEYVVVKIHRAAKAACGHILSNHRVQLRKAVWELGVIDDLIEN